MAKYLATYSDTINNVEVTGFNVMTDKDVDKFEELASEITWYFDFQVGEESIEYNGGEDLISRIDFREISNEEYKALKKVFEEGFGIYVTEDFLLQIIGEEEEELDEEDDEEELDEEDDDY